MGIFRFGAKKKAIKVTVQLLDDGETITSEFKRSESAQAILDYVLEMMNIKEMDYFGLRYQDHERHRFWVDLSKPIAHMAKQFKFTVPDTLTLRLRFRFYPNDPHLLREEITRYQLFVQLQRDLLHGRLYCPQGTAAQLAALVLQSQLGDYDAEIHGDNYASKYKLLLKQTPKVEERIEELHREMKGKFSAAEAELEFLERACELDTYGFDPYTVKDHRESNQSIFLGATHRGIIIYKGNIKAHQIAWKQLTKADYFGQELRITPTDDYLPPMSSMNLTSDENKEKISPKEKKKLTIKFICPSQVFAKHLWTHILSQQAFFNDASASTVKPKFSKPRIPLLGRGSSFVFPSRRVLHEIETSDESTPRLEVSFHRYTLPKQDPRPEAIWLNRSHFQTSLINGDLQNKEQKFLANGNNNSKIDRQESLLTEMERLVKEPRVNVVEDRSATQKRIENQNEEIQPLPTQKAVIVKTITKISEPFIENKAQFAVHLVKYERVTGTLVSVEKTISTVLEAIGEPLLTSTPTSDSQLLRRSNHSTAESPLSTNGHLKSNGSSAAPKKKSDKPVSTSSWQSLSNIIFITLLVVLLLITLTIAVFETQREDRTNQWLPFAWHRSTPDWMTSSNEKLSRFRQEYYEPTRQAFLSLYARFVPQR